MELKIQNIEQLPEVVGKFIETMDDRTVYAFRGEMGAGKTTFIKAVCEQLGVKDAVTSPTFAIVNEYASDFGPVYHFDFYRIKNLGEVMDLGFDDYAYSGNFCLMEWPELIEDLLPDNTVNVHIAETSNGMRTVTIG